jgi:hypothetical protein
MARSYTSTQSTTELDHAAVFLLDSCDHVRVRLIHSVRSRVLPDRVTLVQLERRKPYVGISWWWIGKPDFFLHAVLPIDATVFLTLKH